MSLNPARTPFGAVFRTEVVYNLRRAAPYAVCAVFSGNALLWWGWGPAASHGWATNSDPFLVGMFTVFTFMTLPFFVALIMGDAVTRDFRLGVDPLIFSKPVTRGEYLLGKFFGNFFVLVCCQACFVLTLLLLQAASKQGMIVLAPRALPYLKHFLFFIVASSLLLAAACFAVGAITRSVKMVYGLVTSAYLLYIGWQLSIRGLPQRWRVLLDPLVMNWRNVHKSGLSAEQLNAMAITYDGDVIANRVLVVLASCACLALAYLRFPTADRSSASDPSGVTTLRLTESEGFVHGGDAFADDYAMARDEDVAVRRAHAPLPEVRTRTAGAGARLRQFAAALGVELRLLAAERGMVVLVPLTVLLCVAGVGSYEVAPDVSYSAAYAARTADSLLLFLLAAAVFYTGESIHRDRELRVEPVLWGTPVPNFALLLPKFAATLLLSLALMALVAAASAALQLVRSHRPVELTTYFITYALILAPSAAFMIAAAVAAHVSLRDKYAAYALCVGASAALFYLFGSGHNSPVYNFVLYQLWTPADLFARGDGLRFILTQRSYVLALAVLCLALAHLLHPRRPGDGPSSRAWSALAAVFSAALAGLLARLLS
jgi:ABC-2 type transport system permease protein